MDLEQYEAEVSTLRANTVSASSRAVYTSSTVKMLQWMYHNKRHLVSDMWLSNVALDDHGNILRSSIISMLQCAPNNPPIHFEELTAQDFMVWIVTLKKVMVHRLDTVPLTPTELHCSTYIEISALKCRSLWKQN